MSDPLLVITLRWSFGLSILVLSILVATSNRSATSRPMNRYQLGLIVFSLSVGGVLALEYIHASLFRPGFFTDYFFVSLFQILPFIGFCISALKFSSGSSMIRWLIVISSIAWAYYEFSPFWWPINTPELQEKIHEFYGISAYGAWMKIASIGVLKLAILLFLLRGMFQIKDPQKTTFSNNS